MMNDDLKKYQDILVDLTLENKTICLDDIDRENFFDLYNLNVFNEEIYSGLIDFVFSEKSSILKIIDDPLNWQNTEIRKIKLSADEEKQKSLEEFEERENIKNFNEYRNFLEDFYKDNINKKLDILNEKYRFMSNIIVDLGLLCGNNKSKSLYIGYPFVEGYIDNKNYIKMPLFLIPVKLFSKNISWFIEKDLNSKIKINRYITLVLDKMFKSKGVDLKREFRFGDEFNREVVYYVLDSLKNYNITLKFNDGFINKNIEKFHSKYTNYMSKKPYLRVKNSMVVGNFKVIGYEFEDYEHLKELDLSDNIVHKFLNKIQEERSPLIEKSLSGKLYVKDSLDSSQKNAIEFCNRNKISIINSPVDSGKNTTIFNFVLDKISRNEKVLLVSRNSYERDKLYSKFSNLSSIIMKIGDSKKGFYEKFLESFNLIMSFKNDENIFEIFNQIINDIENKYSLVKEAGEVYNNIESFGLSLQQMYEFTIGIDKENLDDNEFKKFTNNNPVSGCTFDEIISTIDKIKLENLIDTFIEYKEYLNKYKIISHIKDDFDINRIEEFVSKIDEIKTKNDTIELNVEKNDCTFKICELLKQFDLTKNEVISRTKKLYLDNNDEEEQKNKNDESWFKGLSFLKTRKNSKKDDETIEINDGVYKEISNNYDGIHDFLDELDFLQDILKKDNFKFIKEKVLNFEDITDFMVNLKEMLESFDKFLLNSCKVKNCEGILNEVLEYMYENSINKNMMEEILDKILKFSTLINIMRRQHKYGDVLMKYRFVNDHISDIKKLNAERKNNINEFVLGKVRNFAHSFISYEREEQFIEDIMSKHGSPVREYVGEFLNLFLEIFPCVISSFDDVSSKLPMIDGMFDYVIIDEAHEYCVADVLPFIFRGKNLVIFGDKNRINFQSKEYSVISSKDKCVCDNLFKFSIDNYDVNNLKYLYSEGSEVLSNLSNMLFNDDIIKCPNLLRFSNNKNPFNVYKINSHIIDGVNENEAEFVVGLLYDILKNKDEKESVGIITLTKRHANLILEILENRIKLEKEFNFLNYKEQMKNSNNLHMGIYVKTIEEITYRDRRDIIIFSLGNGFNDEGYLEFHVDGLKDNIGFNQLNILSRLSKKDFKIVSSFDIENFNSEDSSENENIKILKKYLFYAKMISIGKLEEAMEEISNSKFKSYKFFGKDIIYDVQQRLIKNGLIVDRNVGNSTYKFDLGIYDSELRKYTLLIDFDGKLINKFEDQVERDIESLIYFSKFGCNVLKLWSRDLWSDLDSQINMIMNFYKERSLQSENSNNFVEDKNNLSRSSFKTMKNLDKTCKELIYKYISNNRK